MLWNSCSAGLSAPRIAVSGSSASLKARGDCRGLIGSVGLAVRQRQLTVVEEDDELAALEDAAVLVAEDRQQQLGVQLLVLGRPLDIEEIRRRRAWTVLEHVVPARVSSGADAHVVRHEIGEVAEPVLGERGPESIECLQCRQAQG